MMYGGRREYNEKRGDVVVFNLNSECNSLSFMSGLEHLDCTGKLLTNNYGGYDNIMTAVFKVSFEH